MPSSRAGSRLASPAHEFPALQLLILSVAAPSGRRSFKVPYGVSCRRIARKEARPTERLPKISVALA
jgi:hypothetical protein